MESGVHFPPFIISAWNIPFDPGWCNSPCCTILATSLVGGCFHGDDSRVVRKGWFRGEDYDGRNLANLWKGNLPGFAPPNVRIATLLFQCPSPPSLRAARSSTNNNKPLLLAVLTPFQSVGLFVSLKYSQNFFHLFHSVLSKNLSSIFLEQTNL